MIMQDAVLQFSGGKDSLACLYLMRPYWDKLIVIWMNSGAAYPETVKQMESIRELVPRFIEVKADQPKHIALHGYPADVVPTAHTSFGAYFRPVGQLIQPWSSCCWANLWAPMQEATLKTGAKIVIRGQRRDEPRPSPIRSGHVENGITYLFPLEDWSEADVFRFLQEEGVSTPESYTWAGTSLDCWSCTAFLDERQQELRNMPNVHPELWPEVKRRLSVIRDAVDADRAYMEVADG